MFKYLCLFIVFYIPCLIFLPFCCLKSYFLLSLFCPYLLPSTHRRLKYFLFVGWVSLNPGASVFLSNFWFLVREARYPILGTRCLVSVFWFLVPGACFLVELTFFFVPGAYFLVPSACRLGSGLSYQVHDVWRLVSSISRLLHNNSAFSVRWSRYSNLG